MSHVVPGGEDCTSVFSAEYNKIINRFESTVMAQFFAHTHNDEIKIFYDTQDPSRATSLAYIGPSVTTYPQLNPGYKVYTVDGVRNGSTFVSSAFLSFIGRKIYVITPRAELQMKHR